MVEVNIKLPDEVALALGNGTEAVTRRIMENAAIENYRAGRLSQRQVGEMLGLNYWQTEGRVQDEILVAAEFPADFEKKYMRVSSRVRTFPPLTPTQWLPKAATIWFPHKRRALRAPWSPLRGEGAAGGRFGA